MMPTYFEEITHAPLLWQEIEQAYTGANRHYHNLRHLENMYAQLLGCRQHISNWRNILIVLDYHDIVYDVLQQNNEEQSAALMVARIRKEYSVYPDEQYYQGRMKVLEHFLNMEYIYKTAYFRDRLEAQARQNLQWEVSAIKSLL